MNAVKRKLNSKSGISLAIALVFFLLCAMVGTVVLSAASASASSTARERQLYRETAALTSAAELLSKDLQKMTFTGSYTRTETVTTTVTTATTSDGEKTSTKVEEKTEYGQGDCKLEGSKFFNMQKNDAVYTGNLILTNLFFSNQTPLGSNPLADTALPTQTITFKAVPGQHIPEVTGKLTVGEDYTITVELHCGENSLTMRFLPQTTSQTTVDEPKIVKSANDTITTKTTVTTYSTTISWEQPVMQEGGANHG